MNKIQTQMLFANRKFLFFAVLPLLLILFSCSEPDQFELKRVTFRVITPPDSGSVFITGNHPDLGNWLPEKVRLARESDTTWINKFYFKPGEVIEYKFTQGSWQSEALDAQGNIPDNSVLKVESDTVINVYITSWANTKLKGRIFISANLIINNDQEVTYGNDFKFHAGDNPEWRKLDFNDSDWPIVGSDLAENQIPDEWNGIGWFRVNLWIDSSLWNKSSGIFINHLGASEVYFNGNLLFSTGTIGNDSSDFVPEQRRVWRSLTWADTTFQIIAIRYANYNWNAQLEKGFYAGFALRLQEINNTISTTFSNVRSLTNSQLLFTMVPLTLAFLHLFIFIFYPYDKQNLFYSLCLFSFAVLSFSINQRFISTDVDEIVFYYSFVPISITLALLFGLYTTYTGNQNKLPRQHYIFLIIAVIISVIGFLKPLSEIFMLIYPFMGLCLFEMVRVVIKSRERSQSAVFIIAGFFFLTLSVIYQVLIDLELLPPPAGTNLVFGYGVLALIFSMSMALSYNFAKINKSLQAQLANVKELSRINLEREKTAQKAELERTLLEADNKRKTLELEEARKLQLSLLPKNIPRVPGYDIAVFMKTATEVGGDYYDFHTTDNTLTTVIGDATGHGARAGTMVLAVKSLFNVLAEEPEPLTMLRKYTNAIKSMSLHNLYMSFSIAKFKDSSLLYSNAGMPPLLVFRLAEGTVEEVIQKSMPLGSFIDFPYTQETIKLNLGDAVLFLSDGFTEAFNPKQELLGLRKAKEIFNKCAHKTAEEIVECLRLDVELWQGSNSPKDDITFVVVKRLN